MTRPILARIDLDALRHNLARARAAAGAGQVLAVAKAAAYGHGLMRVLPALGGADGVGLLDLTDGLKVREAGWRGVVLLMGGVYDPRALREAAAAGLQLVVHCPEQWDMIRRTPLPAPVGIWLKMNTGLNRLGFPPEAFAGVLAEAQASPAVAGVVLMTHFAGADEGRGVEEQMAVFDAVCGPAALPRSLANSAALLRVPAVRAHWTRPGIMLYGGSPFADASAAALGLRPVMTLESRIIAVQQVRAGGGVGYGPVFVADRDVRVGIVACGYGDGYPRHAPTGTPVLVGGRRTRLVGRVSMDMLAVDLEPCPEAGFGTPVVLWGDGLPVEEVAAAAGTIGYELLCALAPRVPGVAVGGTVQPAAAEPA
jgi:alanine racemase